jgi:hypothetical protein
MGGAASRSQELMEAIPESVADQHGFLPCGIRVLPPSTTFNLSDVVVSIEAPWPVSTLNPMLRLPRS